MPTSLEHFDNILPSDQQSQCHAYSSHLKPLINTKGEREREEDTCTCTLYFSSVKNKIV